MAEKIILKELTIFMLDKGYNTASEIPKEEYEKFRKDVMVKVKEWIDK